MGALVLAIFETVAPFYSLAQPTAASEYEIKAGFLMAFTRYAFWPTNAVASTNSPIILGVLGKDPFGEILDITARKERGPHPLQVRRVSTVEEAEKCHVVFIGQSESGNEAGWLEALRDKAILTIGESGRTIERGGVLEFVIVDKRVRYEASWPAMERAGLRLGAPMLASARKVYREPRSR